MSKKLRMFTQFYYCNHCSVGKVVELPMIDIFGNRRQSHVVRNAILISILVCILLLAAGGGLTTLSNTIKAQYQDLAVQVQTVQATVTSCQTIQVSSGRGHYSRGLYTYQFVFQNKNYSSQAQSSPCFDSNFSTMPIKFLPSDPTKSGFNVETIVGDGGSGNLSLAAEFCFIWSLIGPICILNMTYWTRPRNM
jgi:hypothetical protein